MRMVSKCPAAKSRIDAKCSSCQLGLVTLTPRVHASKPCHPGLLRTMILCLLMRGSGVGSRGACTGVAWLRRHQPLDFITGGGQRTQKEKAHGLLGMAPSLHNGEAGIRGARGKKG